MKGAKIVIPGGAGLVGQNLVVQLEKKGYTHLVVIDKHEANLRVLKKLHPYVETILADLSVRGEWEKQFEGASIVIMLQAQIGAPTVESFIRNNIESTKHILKLIRDYAIPYTVHVSSSVVKSVVEDHYAKTKKQQEELVLESGIPCIILRPTLMFGWFDRKHLGWLSRLMKKTPVFAIPGYGRYMRQPLYVGDFCRIIISCLENQRPGEMFNITGLEKLDYVDMIQQIKKTTQAKALILPIPYSVFYTLLKMWAWFDKTPPFTTDQLKALVAHDEFEVIDWPNIFEVKATPFLEAIQETFTDPAYSHIVMEF